MLDSFAGAEVCKELKDSQLLHDRLVPRWRFDERIFEFLTWLRVDEPEQVPLPKRCGRPGPRHLPCEAAADQRAGEPQARARRCSGLAVRGSRHGADECAADHEGLAGAAIDWGRRQGAEGHLPDRGSRGGGRRLPGERPVLRGAGAAEAHSALQRHQLRLGSGPDPVGENVVVRRGVPPLQHQTPLHGLLPNHE